MHRCKHFRCKHPAAVFFPEHCTCAAAFKADVWCAPFLLLLLLLLLLLQEVSLQPT
jgi:hypothetical protein